MAPLHQFLVISGLSSLVISAPTLGWPIRLTSPTLPNNQINNALPSPTGQLKSVQLGLGFQNYSCSATSNTWIQTVPSSGAIADLYDITALVNTATHDTLTRTALHSFETCLTVTKCTPSPANGYCDACHRIAAAPYQPALDGEHFFNQLNGAQTPNFAVKNDFLSCKKVGSAPAPASAYDGQNGLGAVGWLYLIDNGSERTHGLSAVYRVETAGGVAPSSCDEPGSFLEVPYSAEYWFYD